MTFDTYLRVLNTRTLIFKLPRKPDAREDEMMTYKRAVKGIRCGNKNVTEDQKEMETSPKQSEPTRIKIFEGG